MSRAGPLITSFLPILSSNFEMILSIFAQKLDTGEEKEGKRKISRLYVHIFWVMGYTDAIVCFHVNIHHDLRACKNPHNQVVLNGQDS